MPLEVGYMPFAGSDERKQIHMIRSGTYLVKKERWAKVSPGTRELDPLVVIKEGPGLVHFHAC